VVSPVSDRATIWYLARMARAYATRHTCASVMLAVGAGPFYGAQKLGHSLQTLLSIYAKHLPDASTTRKRLEDLATF
jgi:integrase